ncbi:hypothetical protein JCM14469_16460 [Desulfatiferula olefinivorans]
MRASGGPAGGQTFETFDKQVLGEKGGGGGGVVFDAFHRTIVFDGHVFVDLGGGEVVPAVNVVLCRYILRAPPQTPMVS